MDKRFLFSVISTAVSSSNEKSGTREENHSQSGGENRLHPPYQKTHQTSNGLRSDYKIGSRSSDNDSPLSSLPLKNDTDEGSFKLDETENTGEGNGVSNGGFKTISAIFSGHGKLKRLLGTLVQFAMDISLDTGDTVRSLVLGLMVNRNINYILIFNDEQFSVFIIIHDSNPMCDKYRFLAKVFLITYTKLNFV